MTTILNASKLLRAGELDKGISVFEKIFTEEFSRKNKWLEKYKYIIKNPLYEIEHLLVQEKKYCLSLETKYFICFSYFTYTIFKSNPRE